jgi:hypothetical protein
LKEASMNLLTRFRAFCDVIDAMSLQGLMIAVGILIALYVLVLLGFLARLEKTARLSQEIGASPDAAVAPHGRSLGVPPTHPALPRVVGGRRATAPRHVG